MTVGTRKVPFFIPDIGEAEIESVVDTLRSGWLTTGPKTKQFEADFAEYVGAKHAIAVNSATAALTLAADAVGIGRDDEVLVPTMTFTATAEIVVHLGARPVLVDCLPGTLNLDHEALEACITPRTKAIIPVHYGGQACEMDTILDIARRHKLHVIEDAAHALPAKYRGHMIGTIGDVTCFSFYANKTITTGEGGMITTDNEDLAAKMRVRSLHGMSKDAWKRFTAEGSWYYEVVYPGYKCNMSDIQAAIGIHQLKRADQYAVRRRECCEQFSRAFAQLAEVRTLDVQSDRDHAWHLFVIRLDLQRLSINRSEFINQLTAAGIGTSVHYLPLHMHPFYRDAYDLKPQDLPVAQQAFDEIISLPVYPRMTDEDVEYVALAVRRIVEENRRS